MAVAVFLLVLCGIGWVISALSSCPRLAVDMALDKVNLIEAFIWKFIFISYLLPCCSMDGSGQDGSNLP